MCLVKLQNVQADHFGSRLWAVQSVERWRVGILENFARDSPRHEPEVTQALLLLSRAEPPSERGH